MCVDFCCSGTIINYDSYEVIGIQVAVFDVIVRCSDGSTCIGHYEAYGSGGLYGVSFSSNC